MNKPQPMPTDKEMRTAIADRDHEYDHRFVYAVITTGVICRPSCAARPAKRENLRFFPDYGKASEAGYRACKRCHPEERLSKHDKMIEVARYIEANFEQRLTLSDLGQRFDLSPSQMQRSFRSVLRVSPREYQDSIRTNHFRSLLKDGDNISGAIYAAGFGSTSRVYGDAVRHVGMTPAVYRAGGDGERIHYACRETVMGPMMMAATQIGVCFAQFGEHESQLLQTLRDEYPSASLHASTAQNSIELSNWIDALNTHLENRAPRPDLPLDLRGTAFQIMVWRFLLGTGDGDILSYSELAAGIGRPKAVRAAASACGANNIAVLVPCHRVLRGDGKLGGYRWGLDRKRTLIDGERKRRVTS